jgi:DNA repair exonuclease SbcCD ATPase subunit
MRLLEITVRNYRIHRDLTVSLDAHRNVIAGPNESGKSTLMEAIHRALFLKASGNRREHRDMRSNLHAGHPEVALCFEANHKAYRLEKIYSGQNGRVKLTEVGGPGWQAAEAEERLQKIIKENAISLESAWSHVFVQQGRAGENPAGYANAYRDDLVARFQKAGGAVIQQSEKDAAVAAAIARRIDEEFTSAGEPKRQSALGQATAALEGARAALEAARQRYDQREEAIRIWRSATAAIDGASTELRDLRADQAVIRERKGRIDALGRELADARRERDASAERYERIVAHGRQIEDTRRELAEANAARAPLVRAIAAGAEQVGAAKAALEQAERAARACEQDAEATRARLRLVAAWRDRAQAAKDKAEYEAKRARIEELKAQQAERRHALARLPKVTQARLDELGTLARRVDEAEATIRAIAAAVRVIAADHPVRLGDRTLTPGEAHTFTAVTELAIGDGVRLEIAPGGGRGLADARRQLDDARHAHRRLLEELGVTSDGEAFGALREREQLGDAIAHLNERLEEEQGADTLDAALAACAERFAATQAQIDQLAVKFADLREPESLAAAQSAVDALATARDEADAAARVARQQRDEAAAAVAAAEEAQQQQQREADDGRRTVDRLQITLETLTHAHGDDDARAQARAELKADLERRASAVNLLETELAAQQPEMLAQDETRVDRALVKLEGRLSQAQTERDQAAGAIRSDGSADPEADLAVAQAEFTRAEQRHAQVRRCADALRHLHVLFTDKQQQLAEQYTLPLVERANDYLKPVFGTDVKLTLELDGPRVKTLRLYRQSVASEAFEFDVLSGGTREQVAAALRLAIAEVLAEDHDGCLPVVFDDAFTHSDPERTRALQRILDLAATRGLQVIVLTCNPSVYSGFGAREIRIGSPAAAGTVRL